MASLRLSIDSYEASSTMLSSYLTISSRRLIIIPTVRLVVVRHLPRSLLLLLLLHVIVIMIVSAVRLNPRSAAFHSHITVISQANCSTKTQEKHKMTHRLGWKTRNRTDTSETKSKTKNAHLLIHRLFLFYFTRTADERESHGNQEEK